MKNIKTIVDNQSSSDKFILDDKNAIIVVRNLEKNNPYKYTMIHERLEGNDLNIVNSFELKNYWYGVDKSKVLFRDLNLFLVQENSISSDAIYNYKDGKFIVEKGLFNSIITTNNYVDFLKDYNCFLGSFIVETDFSKNDYIVYHNVINNEKMTKCFSYKEYYYALINIDGTIRSNKLFKGNTFWEVTDVIDLNKYHSLKNFKKQRKQELETLKNKEFFDYLKEIVVRNDDSISPYKDSEVLKVLYKI